MEAVGVWGLINWRWALRLCSSACLALCQELDLLISSWITQTYPTVHHTMYCKWLQKQSAEGNETRGQEDGGRSSKEQCGKTEKLWQEMTTDELGRKKDYEKCSIGKDQGHQEIQTGRHIHTGNWERRGGKLKTGRIGGENQKEKHSLRQAEHSREVDEGTQMSIEANREEFQTERVCVLERVCDCEFVCTACSSVCPDNSICCPFTGLLLRLHS